MALPLRLFKLSCDAIDRVVESAAAHCRVVVGTVTTGACAGRPVPRSAGNMSSKGLSEPVMAPDAALTGATARLVEEVLRDGGRRRTFTCCDP